MKPLNRDSVSFMASQPPSCRRSRSRGRRRVGRWVALAVPPLLALSATTASAQYFGRNKVHWERFDFHVLATEHFDIYSYPEHNRGVDAAARMAERWYARLEHIFDFPLAQRTPIVLYNNHADFQQTAITGGLIGQGVGGFTESMLDRLVMPMTGSMADTDHVLGHEMVHVFEFSIARAVLADSKERAQPLPLWMSEGLAEYLSTGPVDAHTLMWLRDAVITDTLPDLADLTRDSRFFPYRWGQAFWSYVGGRWGDDKVVETYVKAITAGPKGAILRVLGIRPEDLFRDWRAAISSAVGPTIEAARAGREGHRLIGTGEEDQPLNLAPVLSPDGRRLAFLSSRDLFEIALYLADARTGAVEGRLVSARSDPHFDALRFLDSAGTWSPDGERFAFVVYSEGDNLIAIADAASGRIERRVPMPGVPSILNLAWSPDGRRLAVAATEQGVSDLYLLDLESGTVTRLTDDLYAELEPSWSPDGRTLVFATDRGQGSDPEELRFGPLHVGLYDLASGSVRTLVVFDGAKHVSPQFSPDGRSLYFISDPDGVSNVYRYDLAHHRVFEVTRVATGVTGITANAPALSVARTDGRLAYTVFENTDYSVYSVAAEEAVGRPVEAGPFVTTDALLPPPPPREDEALITTLREPREALPPPSEPPSRPYTPRLKLASLGPAMVGTGYDQYGFGVAGGISVYLTDVLGNHQIGISTSGATYSADQLLFAAQGTYLNLGHRLAWGGLVSQLPYLRSSTFITSEPAEVDGEPVTADVVNQIRETVTVRNAAALAAYPLSMTRRFEVRGGYTDVGFDNVLERAVVVNGEVVDRTREHVAGRQGYGYTDVSAAYVVDSSYFAFTSPVTGTRMRLELGQVLGDFDFQTALADYRHYVFFRPATFAFRALHFGRYGGGADDPRLAPLNVGQPLLIRGYSVGSFNLGECTPVPGQTAACPELDRLEGSRLGVLNLELRLQVLGNHQLGLVNAPFAATELAAFVDVGGAWTRDQPLRLRFDRSTSERTPVVSAGIAARILLGGFVPIQLYYAHPFQRPQRDWVFGFVIAPGW